MDSAPKPASPILPPPLNDEAQPAPEENQTADPTQLLEIGLEKLRGDQIEEAIQALSKALKLACLKFGDVSDETAVFYYHYGDALLRQFENSQSDNLFGSAVPQEIVYSDDEAPPNEEAEPKAEASEIQGTGEEEVKQRPSNSNDSSSEEEQAGEQEPEGDAEEQGQAVSLEEGAKALEVAPEPNADEPELEDGDMQICWEVLDSCRVILERSRSDVNLLYKVLLRIGDLQTWNERLEDAKEEYSKALEVLGELEGVRPSRNRAEVYYLLGNNSLCRVGFEANAADFFTQALGVLNELKLTSSPADAEELAGLIIEIGQKREEALEQQKSFQAIRESQTVEEDGLGKPQIATGTVTELGVLGKRKRPEDQNEFVGKKPKLSP